MAIYHIRWSSIKDIRKIDIVLRRIKSLSSIKKINISNFRISKKVQKIASSIVDRNKSER